MRWASAAASRHTGTLRKKHQRQLTESTTSPPSSGPTIGAICAGTDTAAVTRPSRCGPAACTSSVAPTGRSTPPAAPCSTRNAIRLPADQAAPASTDATPNARTDPIHIRRAPNRSTAHPVAGVTIAMASR